MRKRRWIVPLVWLLILFFLVGAGYLAYRYICDEYRVVNVTVDGNIHLTDEEVASIVMEGRFGDNTLFLRNKYKNKEITDVPFVETMAIEVVDKNSIRIHVYEKTLAGFIEYLGRYIYFDKDGIVVETSNVKTVGVPEVLGISFDYVVLHEPLPATDPNLFKEVLYLTNLCSKYGVDGEKIYFKSNGDEILYTGDIIVNLGHGKDLDLLMMNLPAMLSKLEGHSGTLHMEKFDEKTGKAYFESSGDKNGKTD